MLLESKIHILFQQNTKEIKEDISIDKLKISSLQKAIILQDKFTETLKNRSSVYYSIKIILYNSFSPVYYIPLGTSTCCQLKVFLPSKRKGLLQHTVDNELSALARFAFYENLLIGRKQVSVVKH